MDKKTLAEKSTKLVEYLLKIARASFTPVINVEKYEKVFWFSQMPSVSHCFSRDWFDRTEEKAKGLIQIKKVPEPQEPKEPEESKKANLTDCPKVKQARNNFNKKWDNWALQYDAWEKVQKVYSDLYSIYQKQQKDREAYELILGIGLLQYKIKDGVYFKRHLLVANVDLNLDAKNMKFTVEPDSAGMNLRAETDMFSGRDLPELPLKTENDVSELLLQDVDDPLEINNLEAILKTIFNSVFSNGEYFRQLKPSQNFKKPTLTFAPAIILRKYSAQGRINALKCIKNRQEMQAGNNVKLLDVFLNLIETQDTREYSEQENVSFSNEEVFFPKPYNDEQMSIVQKMNSSNGALVQGPPGTGKSHTIANLICHLLAKGQRILVTAKTSRALSVLRGANTGKYKVAYC
ncbi:MAG: AAA family ATPase [Holosporales bacterium]|jgi:hypothetical protein|nr:AAA family ATPase [Holosporales bacterium]